MAKSSTDTRSAIVQATNEVFRRVGYNGASMAEISRASGATTGSIYHFFPSGKAELARAAVLEAGDAYRQLFELIADAEPDLADGVKAFFVGAADVLEADDYIDPCPIGTVAREVASTDDDLREATSEVFASWTTALGTRLSERGAGEANAAAVAAAVIGMLEGGFIIARTHRDAQLLRTMGTQAATLIKICLAKV